MGYVTDGVLQPGTVLENKWIIIELIGKGAMGEVYRAHQVNLKRDVAIKVIARHVLAEVEEDPEELDVAFARFRREVQTMARVRHPNILTIYDYGEVEDAEGRTAYIVMEYIPGNSLRFTMSEDGLDDEPEAYDDWLTKYFLPVLDGVTVLHDNKIVHRDLKPENIFMDGEVPKIADFGLARSCQMKTVTTSVEMLGTLAYMSPEQCADFKTADYTTDIYALGKMLFEAVNGRLTEKNLPFTSVTITDPKTPFMAAMARIIEKATAEAATDRHQSLADLRREIEKARGELESTGQAPPIGRSARGQVVLRARAPSPLLRLTVFGVAVLVLAIGVAVLYNRFVGDTPPSGLSQAPYVEHDDLQRQSGVIAISGQEPPAPAIIGRDGTRMVLTGAPGPSDGGMLFYMDVHPITNFTFTEFLNLLPEELSVQNGVVRHNASIIFYLGDEAEGMISYQHQRFHLRDQSDGTRPVVRVTYHGAHLFAATYGKELLTEREWRFAYGFHHEPAAGKAESLAGDDPGATTMMHVPSPTRPKPERSDLPDGMEISGKEWVRLGAAGENEAPDNPRVYDSGIIDATQLDGQAAALKRFPWEGFADVGFRTKLPVVIE